MDNSCTLYIRILFIAGPRNPAMTTLNKKYSVDGLPALCRGCN